MLAVAGSPAARAADGKTAAAGPRVFCCDPDGLAKAKSRVAAGDPSLKPALERLRREADKALEAGPFSVMDKSLTPPSGDKHDYMSIGPYWWPDPAKPDGLPYVRRDGEVNPERKAGTTDATAMGRMASAVETLALAYYFTGEERYARHAATLLRTWFLAPKTKMNPNLKYGQAIPGRVEGRGIGIIDTADLVHIPDAVGLLAGSKHWTEADQAGAVAWFDAYLDWLRTSKEGAKPRTRQGTGG
jgi:hypothetical protein